MCIGGKLSLLIEIQLDVLYNTKFPKSGILLMNWLEVINVSVVRLVWIMYLNSFNGYCHVFFGANQFLVESMDVSHLLTLTSTFGLCELMSRGNYIKGVLV